MQYDSNSTPRSSPRPKGTVEPSFSITELAEAFSVTPRSLRFYEDHGLLSPHRHKGTRRYSSADRARLAWVLRGKRVGFTLAEIKDMLDLYHAQDGRTQQRIKTLEKCQERIASLHNQRRDLDHIIDELSDFCHTLERMLQNPCHKA